MLGISPVLWAILIGTWLFGMLSFVLLSLLVGPLIPTKYRDGLVGIWIKLAMLTADRALLVLRRDGSYEFLPSKYDPETETEVVYIEGERRDFTDSNGLMSSLARRKLGVAVEGVGPVLNSAVAAIGRPQRDKIDQGEGEVKAMTDGGYANKKQEIMDWYADVGPEQFAEASLDAGGVFKAFWDSDVPEGTDESGNPIRERGEWVSAINPYTKLRENDVVVDMRAIWSILEGSSDSDTAQRVQKRAIASQAKLGGDQTKRIVLYAGAAMILGWVLRDISIQGGGGGGSVIQLPTFGTILPPVDVLASVTGQLAPVLGVIL